MAHIEVKLFRQDRVYRPPDVVDGVVFITSNSNISHQGIRLTATGTVHIKLSTKLEKSIQLMKKTINLTSGGGKIGLGKSEFPFHFSLTDTKDEVLHETYHGACINVQYLLIVEVLRGYLSKPLAAAVELVLEKCTTVQRRFIDFTSFYITQDTQTHLLLPAIRAGGFKVVGKVSNQCALSEPITGELTIEHCAVPISSIEIQILRVEVVLLTDKRTVERSLIQTTQIADGDVCRGQPLTIYVILPRLLTCPQLSAGIFSLDFELQISISFDIGLNFQSKQTVAFDSFPLKLFR